MANTSFFKGGNTPNKQDDVQDLVRTIEEKIVEFDAAIALANEAAGIATTQAGISTDEAVESAGSASAANTSELRAAESADLASFRAQETASHLAASTTAVESAQLHANNSLNSAGVASAKALAAEDARVAAVAAQEATEAAALSMDADNIVHRTGDETIAGAKTFTSPVVATLTGNASTATKLATARNINGKAFDGTADINTGTISDSTITLTATGQSGTSLRSMSAAIWAIYGANTYYVPDGAIGLEFAHGGGTKYGTVHGSTTGLGLLDNQSRPVFRANYASTGAPVTGSILTSLLSISGKTLFGKDTDDGSGAIVQINGSAKATSFIGSLTGNADTTTKLATARTINGVSFDGTGNITVADDTKLPLTGGTVTGALNVVNTATTTAEVNVYGTGGQGTGRLYVGQDINYGGGIEYNGDSNPVTSGSGDDYITLYRRQNGVNEWTARNQYASNNWEFRGTVTAVAFAGNATSASTALKLTNARTINGVSFDGTASITIADDTKVKRAATSMGTADYDTFDQSGVFRAQGGANGPNGTNHTTVLQATQANNNYGFQLASETDNTVWLRTKGTLWDSWQKLYHSGNLTKATLGLGNVEDKSSATIRSEITSGNVTTALGYTPVNKAGDTLSGSLAFTGGHGILGGAYGGTARIWGFDAANPGYGIYYKEGSPDSMRFDVSGAANTPGVTPDLELTSNTLKVDGAVVWHAANLTNLNQLTNGPGYITSAGNAATATKLATARNINGVPFDGTADITLAADTDPRFGERRNMIDNALFAINQRGNTGVSGNHNYTYDRWKYETNLASTVLMEALDDSASPANKDYGSGAYLQTRTTSTNATLAAGDYGAISHIIDGTVARKLRWGTSDAKPLVITFRGSVSVAGTVCVSVRNGGTTLSYVVPVAMGTTPSEYTITIPGVASGTWPSSGACIRLFFTHFCGTTFQTTANTWVNGNFLATSAQSNYRNIAGGSIRIANVQAEVGSKTPFESVPYDVEFYRCSRYFTRLGWVKSPIFITYTANGDTRGQIRWPVPMRVAPTLSFSTQAWSAIGFGNAGSVTNVVTNISPYNITTTGTEINGDTAFASAGGIVIWGASTSVDLHASADLL